ncbi:MAG: hypothetical protein EPN91_02080 [Salinibacterium sp.]|nr:MAG: hypothetical protein EPN91_02080 [Salinibacterium sp.]
MAGVVDAVVFGLQAAVEILGLVPNKEDKAADTKAAIKAAAEEKPLAEPYFETHPPKKES